MDYQQRMERVRLYGPRRPILRHILLMLCLYDTEDGGLVFGGRLEDETGYSDRAIRRALRELVEMGWLKPEKEARPTDPRQRSANQYGPSGQARVHGHLGGRRPGGDGCKTRYWIVYRSSRAPERPPARNVKKGERGAAEGGTGGRPSDRRTPSYEPERGNGGPERGTGGPKKGDPRSPDSISERENNRDAGGVPPGPPGEVASGSPYGDPGSPHPAAGAAGHGPQGSLPGAGAPEGPQGSSSLEAGRQLASCWPEIVRHAVEAIPEPERVAMRLWFATPKVRPLRIAGGILHLVCPSPFYAARVEGFAPTILATVSERLAPVTALVCHPATSEAA